MLMMGVLKLYNYPGQSTIDMVEIMYTSIIFFQNTITIFIVLPNILKAYTSLLDRLACKINKNQSIKI